MSKVFHNFYKSIILCITILLIHTIFTIPVADVPKEDLIKHFPETNEFISNAQEKGSVLVHW